MALRMGGHRATSGRSRAAPTCARIVRPSPTCAAFAYCAPLGASGVQRARYHRHYYYNCFLFVFLPGQKCSRREITLGPSLQRAHPAGQVCSAALSCAAPIQKRGRLDGRLQDVFRGLLFVCLSLSLFHLGPPRKLTVAHETPFDQSWRRI